MIRATVQSDDNEASAEFDATGYFDTLSKEEFDELAGCDFGGDYPADEVARYARDEDVDVGNVFRYLEEFNIGFECHVNPEDARTWQRTNRPEWS